MSEHLTLDFSQALMPQIADGPVDEEHASTIMQAVLDGFNKSKNDGRIGFADVPLTDAEFKTIREAALGYADYDAVVVLGIGGSALGLQALSQAIFGAYGRESPRREGVKPLVIIDTLEPDTVHDALSLVRGKKTLFIAVSKSGNTLETLAVLDVVERFIASGEQGTLFAITDPEKGALRSLATKKNWPSLVVPPQVGGRFSVLTAVGLFPLAVCGADIAALLRGAKNMEHSCREKQATKNPAARLAGILQAWIERGMTQFVCMPYGDRLRYLADWFTQLWGESLGKRHDLSGKEVRNGTTLIRALGPHDQHSQLQLYLDGPRDKFVLFLAADTYDSPLHLDRKNAGFLARELAGKSLLDLMNAEREATAEALRRKGRPNSLLRLPRIDEEPLGAILQLCMNTVSLLGYHQNINPFDQPAVEEIKNLTRERLLANGKMS